MNQTEQMRQALIAMLMKLPRVHCENLHHKQSHLHDVDKPCPALLEYEAAVIKAEQALAAEPAPLVRLTRYDAAALELECTDRETGLLDAEKFANAIMDALEAKNGGKV